jgi:hypothetical protein
LPPNYQSVPPEGYITIPLQTVNGSGMLRLTTEDESAEGIRHALATVRRLRLYSFARVAQPTASRFIDMSGRLFDGIVRFDLRYYDGLARMLDEEAALVRDADVLHDLKTLGMASYERFSPDPYIETMLADAAAQIRDQMRRGLRRAHTPYWSDRHWVSPLSGTGPQAGFVSVDGELDVQARALFYFHACAPSAKAALAPFELQTFADASRRALSGEHVYRLRVPAHVPAAQFWTATAYATATATFFRESPSLAVDARDRGVMHNEDGSVDLYFGSRPPAGHEHNWIATGAGEPWFLSFRFHDPLKQVLDKSWKLPDLEPIV